MAFFDAFSLDEILTMDPLDGQDLVKLGSCSAVSSAGSFDFREEQKYHRYRLHECLFNVLVHGLANAFAF